MIYLDHAATVPMTKESLRVMEQAMENIYGNASASYAPAARARTLLDQSREILAEGIGADFSEVYFTSGGTEGDNWALLAGMDAMKDAGKPGLVTSSIEHHAVLHTADYLEAHGTPVIKLPVNREGLVSPDALDRTLSQHPETGLVSIMWANNEVGTIEPIKELAAVAKAHGCLFHTDAVQAYGKLKIDLREVPADLLCVSAHKIGGPKGIGFLFIRKGVSIGSLLHGGEQERGRRAGTENVPAAAGFAAAFEEVSRNEDIRNKTVGSLQLYFRDQLEKTFGSSMCWNGPEPGKHRLPGNLSISFPGLQARSILMNLDLAGICASAGSACTTGLQTPSHVILAMTGDPDRAQGTIRFTLGPENTRGEIDTVCCVLKQTITRLDSLSKS